MTEQHINVAIAEACGWQTNGIEWWIGDGNDSQEQPPDYCNDLNAMHDAEKSLHNDKWMSYVKTIMRMCENHKGMIHATARQRAEAFLRTLGKWTEETV